MIDSNSDKTGDNRYNDDSDDDYDSDDDDCDDNVMMMINQCLLQVDRITLLRTDGISYNVLQYKKKRITRKRWNDNY